MEPLPTTASALPERAKFIATAGWFILLLSAGSALLPLYGKTLQGVLGNRPCRVLVAADPTAEPATAPV